MIGTIRKHSGLLWWSIIPLTIISFVMSRASRPGHNGGCRSSGGYDTIYGHEITAETFYAARNELYLSYWQQTGEWPDKSPSFSRDSLDQQVYVRLLLKQKANDLGIHVNEDTVESATAEMLRSMGRGQPVSLEQFVQSKQI